MSDADAASHTPETYSAEFVAQLKAELAQEKSEKHEFKNKLSGWEAQRRATLTELRPCVQEWIKEGMEAGADFKHELAPMASFGDNLHESANLDSALPLARMISVFSAKVKRERQEFSKASAASEMLGKANKQVEELQLETASQKARIGELESLVAERTGAAEKLSEQLSKAGLVRESFDFSKAAARETEPAAGATTGVSAKAAPAAPMIDPLLAFVQRGSGSGKLRASNTSHHLLGASQGDGDISSALRFA
jgi:uncharacterized coiled-coil protein SlyX